MPTNSGAREERRSRLGGIRPRAPPPPRPPPPPLAFEALVPRNQRPKVDVYDDYLFIVLYFPSYDKTTGRLKAVELDLFVGPDYLITLPNERFVQLSRLFDRVAGNDETPGGPLALGP